MIPHGLTQADLLDLWERGEGERPLRRARSLVAAATAEDSVAMTVGHRDSLLLALREQLFGSAFAGVTACPACGCEIEVSFDAQEVRRTSAAAEESFRIEAAGHEVEFRLPRASDVERLDGMEDVSLARETLLASCVARVSRDGTPIDVRTLSPEVVDAVAARMRELDPQADVALDVTCPTCGDAWQEPFDVLTFLWSELTSAARRLLGEVHLLAAAYGWNERDILQMSPVRRGAYIGMLS